MRPKDEALAGRLETALVSYSATKVNLAGILEKNMRECFLEQLLESIRRVEYVKVISTRKISKCRADPAADIFDPIYAAIYHQKNGDIEEAFWLVFLFVHFGKHARGGWRYLKDVYGSLGKGPLWTWSRTSADPGEFRDWLADSIYMISGSRSPGGFGNHRKYQSLDAYKEFGTGSAVESYVNWTGQSKSQKDLFMCFCDQANGDFYKAFDSLYRSMNSVASFGRTAKFDYLAMVGKLDLAPIKPGSAYLDGSTGPIIGATLLYFGTITAKVSPKKLDLWLQELNAFLNVGMQPLEDALCNWQKSPKKFRAFRG